MRFFLISLIVLLSTSLRAADIEVTVDGVTQAKGSMLIGLYNDATDFRVKELPQSPKIAITSPGKITTVIKNVPPGVYAIAAVWDLNDNGILDTKGRLKMPQEPFGFSNNAKPRFGPPSFEKCRVQIPEAGGKIQIKLIVK